VSGDQVIRGGGRGRLKFVNELVVFDADLGQRENECMSGSGFARSYAATGRGNAAPQGISASLRDEEGAGLVRTD